VDESKISKYKDNWALGWSNWLINILKSPKLYITFAFLLVLWRLK
jgi:hypothetical protein